MWSGKKQKALWHDCDTETQAVATYACISLFFFPSTLLSSLKSESMIG